MNSLIIFEHEINGKIITIADEYKLTHLHQVLKVKEEQDLKITILNKGLGNATVTKIDSEKVELELISEIESKNYPEWHLLVGLSRPPTMKKILEHATSLGVTHFHFFKAELSEKSYGDSKIWEQQSIKKLLLDGLSQSSRYWKLPKVQHYKNLQSVETFEGFDRRLCSLSKGANEKMKNLNPRQALVIAFGPERGLTMKEDNALQSMGFQAFSLGPGILRVEIAVFSSLGQCHLLL